ncbi:hypothetical protein BY458DRAFT_490806 [Sporodiniella umbellata]|nr:hypothetical protein BY458DRAFT_490806 [Sporodiniella umbellata]
MSLNGQTPYETLGVGKYTSQKDIRKRYLDLCKQYHPDVSKSKNTIEQFRNIKCAYEILTHKTVPRQPLISTKPVTVIDTQIWTRRSLLGGFGLMAAVFWYVSYNSNDKITYTTLARPRKTTVSWQESGMSYRQWKNQ